MFDVLTIGTATRDVFLTSPYFKVLRDPEHLKKIGFTEGEAECFAFGAKIDVGEPVFTTGGGATNAAVTFARQGLKTAALISLGHDESANAVSIDLQSEKVTPLISYSKKHATAYSTLLLSRTGERTVLVARGAADDLRISPKILAGAKASWVYIAPGAIPFAVISKLIHYFASTGAHIAINPSGYYLKFGIRRLQPLLKRAHVIILNRAEASQLTGANYENERAIFTRFESLFGGLTVMTDGAKGVTVSNGKIIYRAGIFKEKALIDRTGAGDAFGSGFVAGLLKQSPNVKTGELYSDHAIEEAIRLASANATSVVEYIGAKTGILTAAKLSHDPRFRNLVIRKTLA
ncbi:MAG: carbohydrate kinase family protein [bacterium]|nr:carbohydrate kinase family protein [bacterium]